MAKRRIWKNKPKAVREAQRKPAPVPGRKRHNYLENTARSLRQLQDAIGPATSGGGR